MSICKGLKEEEGPSKKTEKRPKMQEGSKSQGKIEFQRGSVS
jgi:hypothetical protein